MDFLIVTGLSGAGKSRAMDALEDIGFFCIDNMPPALMFKFAQMYKQADTKIPKLAIGIDARSGQMFKEFANQIGLLKENLITYKILFLDCADETLVSRYKETRRKHPLVSVQTQLKEAIAMDREFLM
ncbi:MAG: RNase adapter RapZ, partial [Oscillospiraceae bacterium]